MIGTYFDQFNVWILILIQFFGGNLRICFSNSSLMVWVPVIFVLLLFKSDKLIPSRWQIVMELIYSYIRSLVQESLGKTGSKYFPFVLCIFLYIGILNIMGLFPYVFTPTAHLVVTLSMSWSIMIAVTLLGVLKLKIEFFSILVPGGVPLVLAPFLVIIETLSYIIRAISLGVRLAANISAGHLLFAILSGFAYNLLLTGFIVLGILSVLIMVLITFLEMMVAIIQSYVFSLLTTIYLGDSLELHES